MRAAASASGPVLCLCHLSALERAVAAVRPQTDGVAVHALVYGRSREQAAVPEGVQLVSLPNLEGSRLEQLRGLARFGRNLRRRGYRVAYVAQPNLRLSRARGLLLSLPVLAGAERVIILDPASGAREEVSPATALADLARWLGLQAGGYAIAATARAVTARLTPRTAGASATLPRTGTILYLRTDLDLALAPLAVGGSASHTEGIVRGFEHHGFTVDVWSTGDIIGMTGPLELRRLPVVLAGNLPTEVAELLSGIRQAVVLLRNHKHPDLIYQRYSLNNLAGLIVARWRGIPFVLEANVSEAQWREEWSALTHAGLSHACERLLLTHADRVTTVSENARAGLLTAGAPSERLRVVPNGVETERFAGARPAALPFGTDTIVFCFSGLFYPWHGVPVLAGAFARVHQADPRARLVLVGDGEEMAAVRTALERGGASQAALITGLVPRARVPGYLAAADVLVSPHAPHPSFVGSPIKIFEYLAASKALIVTRVGQMADLLEDRRTALLVEPGDAPALADAMLTLLRDDLLRHQLAQGAAQEARKHSWDARVAELFES